MSAPVDGDYICLLDPDGLHYVATIDGEWWRWPAVARGWLSRRRVSEAAADGCEEVADGRLAELALRLSGAGT